MGVRYWPSAFLVFYLLRRNIYPCYRVSPFNGFYKKIARSGFRADVFFSILGLGAWLVFYSEYPPYAGANVRVSTLGVFIRQELCGKRKN